ncbi:ABC transporter ATP-binding protein [Corticibacter populi]|uniref:ABC transporter ATP-binding protein n=1 Tax=Corticibacter populi TaxID=1550736 RepID=A0A3M6QVL2_9BURK|nr:ABC transporter ATP-binding protein [Corticibacter populi]RMX06609.1 ABC transporter ATP-binding protein [Corticibacter populi]RZS31821.1 branched-chain amino acid transport system ATP-binding protein [Corticibacter populi]
MRQTQPALSCQDVTMRFGGLVALDSFSLEVHPGDVVGLLGPNGSGKTTFFNVVTGLYKPAAGTIRFGGTDLFGKPPAEINRAGIARSFQRCRLLLELSVFDNLLIGAHNRLNNGLLHNLFARKAAQHSITSFIGAARDLCARFNPYIADHLFDPAGAFNMIDRRRIELCRALLGEPRLLLLDEPSAGMTHEETFSLMDDVTSFQRQNPDLSIILIEHEMQVIERVSQRCVVLNFGKKICEGSYREVIADPQVLEAYLGEDA